ncbi:hypothetical protein, partial [Psychroserpens luteolus]|uniref:hypothetical protein n=1 Tax=Psychroserpens luteolus TaxID=2855840 RepID=UPI001E5C85EB
FHHGADHARNVALVMAVAMQHPPAPDLENQIAKAAGATFPLNAGDLMPAYEGAALGARIKELQAKWIASDFAMTREDLLAQ